MLFPVEARPDSHLVLEFSQRVLVPSFHFAFDRFWRQKKNVAAVSARRVTGGTGCEGFGAGWTYTRLQGPAPLKGAMSWSFSARPHPMLPPAAEYELPDFELRDESQVGSCFALICTLWLTRQGLHRNRWVSNGTVGAVGSAPAVASDRSACWSLAMRSATWTTPGAPPDLPGPVPHADPAFCSVPGTIWCVRVPKLTCLLLGFGQGRVAERGRSAFAVVPASARDRSLCTTRRIACCRRMA